MLKINVQNLEVDLQRGLSFMAQYDFLKLDTRGLQISAERGTGICLKRTKKHLGITYDTISHFYMALVRGIQMEVGEQQIHPRVEKLGFMLDCSRNAVPKVEEIKRLICLLVLMGYNYLELYTEDTYELPNEPYFGYKRGRYSREELREIVIFARQFEMGVVPCIQTLAHLKNLANWKPYFDHMDIDDILLVEDERTYALIRKMLMFCKEVYDTTRVHIGLDEAFHLGRGKYTDTYGYRSKHEIYLQHLKKVFAICEEVGVLPEFWADGFYDTDLQIEDIQAIFNEKQTPIYWEYSVAETAPHIEKLEQLKTYAGKVIYAGGLWKWIGFAPSNDFSDKVNDKALEAAFACGVEDIVMTAWGDNGAECSVYAIIPAMWHVTELVYPMKTPSTAIVRELTGYSDAEWRMCDVLNQVVDGVDRLSNGIKYLLSNDLLIGLLDANIPENAGEHYEKLVGIFTELANKDSQFAYIFRTYASACKLLTNKATYGKRLYAAYQREDLDAIQMLRDELPVMKEHVTEFHVHFREQWMREHKGFGFEVMDVRIGSLISRIQTVQWMLGEYLAGRMPVIYELEEERLEYFCGQLQGKEVFAPLHNHWATAYTVNHI